MSMKKTAPFKRAAVLFASAFAVAACTSVTETSVDETAAYNWRADFSDQRIRADLEFLAADEMQGRDALSEEYKVAANYVAAEFKRLGLKPMGDNGTYFQQVPFVQYSLDLKQSSFELTVGGETSTLKLAADYLLSASLSEKETDIAADMVFVGYGIQAPEVGLTELDGVDLNGKIAVLYSGAPSTFPTDLQAHFRGARGKTEALASRGAKGVLIIGSPFRGNEWNEEVYKGFVQRKSTSWLPKGEVDPARNMVISYIHTDIADKIFKASGTSLEAVEADKEAGKMTSAALKASAKIKRVSDFDLNTVINSPNVVAVLEGTDPKLKHEYVFATAHLDHVGVSEHAEGDADDKDLIHNGAMDNASGVSVMLEVARNFAKTGKAPKRSIIFSAVTAEEKGLLGAEYLINNPPVALGDVAANVNLDMPLVLYDFVDVIAFGAEHSTLGPIAQQATAALGVEITPDPIPEQGIFTRSDHYRFVQKGVPALFLITGFGETPDGENGGEIFRNFLSTTYHSPADQPSLPIRYDAAAKFAYVNYLILRETANVAERPHWNEGDIFGAGQ